MGYAPSPFRDFESYMRIVVGLDEDDIQLLLKQYTLNFVSYEVPAGVYTIIVVSEPVCTMEDHEGTLQIDHVDVTMKTKLL